MRRFLVALAVVAIVLVVAVLSTLYLGAPGILPGPRPMALPPKPREPFTRVEVYFATDRQSAGERAGIARYHAKWSPQLEYGRAEVSVPHDHRVGRVESPSIWRLEFRPDPRKHIVLQSAKRLAAEDFRKRIRTSVQKSSRHELLLFVHGFNVTFEATLMRTAQIAYDLQLPGVPIAYSWPSQGELNPVAYVADGNVAEVTVPHLKVLLTTLATETGAERIHVIAHSMGNKVLTRALDAIVADTAVMPKPVFNNIALTAPDIDENVMTDIAARIHPLAKRITLYASSNDEALKLASRYTKSRRAGQAGPAIMILPRIDTVDASAVDTSLIGHFYYAGNVSVLSDIFYLFREERPPGDRFLLQAIETTRGTYWAFRKPG